MDLPQRKKGQNKSKKEILIFKFFSQFTFRYVGIYFIVGQKIKKSPGQQNSWNQINQFHEISFDQIPFFAISKHGQKSIFELVE